MTVFLVGGQKTGKTTVANFLADLSDSLNGSDYHPTQGVRILEFERAIRVGNKAKETIIAVELWDCSGDPVYMSNWPAVASSANAVIYISPPAPDKKTEKELEGWYNIFSFLRETQMSIFCHKIGVGAPKGAKPKFGKPLAKIPTVFTSLEEPEHLKSEFDNILAAAYFVHTENREREEQSIVA
ncbi:Intraflagellar transport protein 22 [Blyttiomyces sp. JEL0837]|nr:Intraflagellar transport protein 22 [Blyttiomyces sp. JEL0837]